MNFLTTLKSRELQDSLNYRKKEQKKDPNRVFDLGLFNNYVRLFYLFIPILFTHATYFCRFTSCWAAVTANS